MKTTPELNSKQMIITAVTVLVAIGLGVIVLQQYDASVKAVAQLTTQQNHLAKIKKEIEETRNSIEKFKKEQAEFKGMLFDERDIPSFLDGISASAAKSAVYVVDMQSQQFSEVKVPKHVLDSGGKIQKVKNYEVDDEREKSPKEELNEMLTLAAMPINFKIRGDFQAIVNFMNSIENYRQLLNVSNVEISNGSSYPYLTCQFTLKIYSLKKLGDINP